VEVEFEYFVELEGLFEFCHLLDIIMNKNGKKEETN
jgi:hypothetical protein